MAPLATSSPEPLASSFSLTRHCSSRYGPCSLKTKTGADAGGFVSRSPYNLLLTQPATAVFCYSGFAMLAAYRSIPLGSQTKPYEQLQAVTAQTSSVEILCHSWPSFSMHVGHRRLRCLHLFGPANPQSQHVSQRHLRGPAAYLRQRRRIIGRVR